MTPAARALSHYDYPLNTTALWKLPPPPPQVHSASDPRSLTLEGPLALCLGRESRMMGHRGQMLLSDASNKCMNKLLDKWTAGLKSLEKNQRFELYWVVVEEKEGKETDLKLCSFLSLEACNLNFSAERHSFDWLMKKLRWNHKTKVWDWSWVCSCAEKARKNPKIGL